MLMKSIQQASDPSQAMLALQIADRLEKRRRRRRRRRKVSKSSLSSRSDSSEPSRSSSRGKASPTGTCKKPHRNLSCFKTSYAKATSEVRKAVCSRDGGGVGGRQWETLQPGESRVSWGKQRGFQRIHCILSEVLALAGPDRQVIRSDFLASFDFPTFSACLEWIEDLL